MLGKKEKKKERIQLILTTNRSYSFIHLFICKDQNGNFKLYLFKRM